MKFRTSLISAVIIAGLFSMNSCTKKYICHCDIKYSGMPGLPDSSAKEYDITNTKSGADDLCKKQSGSFDKDGIHTNENCYLY